MGGGLSGLEKDLKNVSIFFRASYQGLLFKSCTAQRVKRQASFQLPVYWWGLLITCGAIVMEHKPVNVYQTGELLSFGCAMTIILYSHTDPSGVLLSSGWKLASCFKKKKKEKKQLLIIYYLKKETLCWDVTASICLLLVSEQISLQSVSEILLCFQIWCTLWECLLCAVTCCRILCMKHQNMWLASCYLRAT